MNRLLVSLGAALLAAFALALPGAVRADDAFKEVTPDQVEKMLGAADVRVYDINDASMFNKHHVPGAVHVGKQKLESLLPADKQVRLVFYCSNTL